MRFKSSGLLDEMARAHPRIQALALYLDEYAKRRLLKDLFVTDVERTQLEYDFVYKTPNYSGPRPHLGPPSRAVDFRTVGELTDDQVKVLVEHVNASWIRGDGKPTALHHDVGSGQHLHVQVEA